jgi:hypothetical protein
MEVAIEVVDLFWQGAASKVRNIKDGLRKNFNL